MTSATTNTFSTSLSNTLSTVSSSDTFSKACTVYKTIVAISFCIGAYKGIQKWYKWINKREYRKMNNYPTIEPIINITSDVGQLGYNVMMAGTASAVVVATAPISVPLLRWKFEEKPNHGVIHDQNTVEMSNKQFI